MTNRLNEHSLSHLPASVATPEYDRPHTLHRHRAPGPGRLSSRTSGVVHRKPARAGSALGHLRGIAAEPDVRDALAAQDNLYTIAVRDETISYEVVGAIRELLVAPESPEAVLQRLCAPATHIVTITVTEKGYCLAGDGALDLAHPDIRRDLENPRAPGSVVGFLSEALRRRRAVGVAPLAVIVSCDNLVDNGAKLARATAQFARTTDAGLARLDRK